MAATVTRIAPRRLVRTTALVALLAVPSTFVAGCSDDGTDDPSRSTIVENPNSTTTGVPQTSSSVPTPTTAPDGTPGTGSLPPQPGGTAQDPMVTNTTQATEAP